MRSAHLSARANWNWSEASWQSRALLQMPASFAGLGVLVLITSVISVVLARGRRSIFATLTAAILVFVMIRALVLANYLIQYLADIRDNFGTMRNISSTSTVLSGFQVVLDFTTFLLVLKDRTRVLAELPLGPPVSKSTISQRILNVLMALILVIVLVLSLARGILSSIANNAVQRGSMSRREYNHQMETLKILGHTWTAAFGIAVGVLGVKTVTLRRRIATFGLSDVPTLVVLTVALPILFAEAVVHISSDIYFTMHQQLRIDQNAYTNALVAFSLLSPMLALAYYSVIVSLGFMRKLWAIAPPMQLVPTSTAHKLKSESVSTV